MHCREEAGELTEVAEKTYEREGTYIDQISDDRVVINLFEESPSLHVVTYLSKLDTESVGAVASVLENVVRVHDDVDESFASFSTLFDQPGSVLLQHSRVNRLVRGYHQ